MNRAFNLFVVTLKIALTVLVSSLRVAFKIGRTWLRYWWLTVPAFAFVVWVYQTKVEPFLSTRAYYSSHIQDGRSIAPPGTPMDSAVRDYLARTDHALIGPILPWAIAALVALVVVIAVTALFYRRSQIAKTKRDIPEDALVSRELFGAMEDLALNSEERQQHEGRAEICQQYAPLNKECICDQRLLQTVPAAPMNMGHPFGPFTVIAADPSGTVHMAKRHRCGPLLHIIHMPAVTPSCNVTL